MWCRDASAPRGAALGALDQQTGFAGSADAVAVWEDTTTPGPGSRTKALVVAVLSWLFEVHQVSAMALGKVMTRAWPAFRRL